MAKTIDIRTAPIGAKTSHDSSGATRTEFQGVETELPNILFSDKVSNHEIGKPVGVSSTGVITYQFGNTEKSLSILPWSEIDEIRVTRETRTWRVLTTIGMLLSCATYGFVGLSALGFRTLGGEYLEGK